MNYRKLRSLLCVTFCGGLLLFPLSSIRAQGGQNQYNSPLYSPKAYDPQNPTTLNGLPNALRNIGIEQRLKEQLPLDAELTDEQGRKVRLGQYFQGDRPVILAFVYYSCPMLCNEVLNGLTGTLKKISLSAGRDFQVVAISFDPRDTPEIARGKKQSYLERYARGDDASAGWHFLTGESEAVRQITEAAGFRYAWDDKTQQFAHAGGVQVATPDGKMAKYFYGIDYKPQDLKFALMEASNKNIGSPADQLLLYCYHYDPATGSYGFAVLRVLRVAGVLTFLGLGLLLLFFKFHKRKPFADDALGLRT